MTPFWYLFWGRFWDPFWIHFWTFWCHQGGPKNTTKGSQNDLQKWVPKGIQDGVPKSAETTVFIVVSARFGSRAEAPKGSPKGSQLARKGSEILSKLEVVLEVQQLPESLFTVIQAFRARLQKLLFLMFLERAKCQNDSKYNGFQHFWEPSKGDPWRGFLGTLGLKGRLLFFPNMI